MPQYLAKEVGFFGEGTKATLYGPGTKRPIVVTDVPLDPVPGWLEPVKAVASDAEVQAGIESQVLAGVNAINEQKKEIGFFSGVGASVIETF